MPCSLLPALYVYYAVRVRVKRACTYTTSIVDVPPRGSVWSLKSLFGTVRRIAFVLLRPAPV